MSADRNATSHAGQHSDELGSFEVEFLEPLEGAGSPPNGTGWYWQSCSPGCLPDGEASGPFDTSLEAYEDATTFGG